MRAIADGFEVQLDCPNNRYVNDEQICIALAGMWAQIKVKVKVDARAARDLLPALEKYDFSMYMLGWGGAITDAETTLTPVMRNNLGEKGIGFYNYGHARNDKLDALAAQSSVEADPKKREALIKAALREFKEQFTALPLHRQVIPWAARSNVERRAPRRQLARGVLGDDRQVTRRSRATSSRAPWRAPAHARAATISRALPWPPRSERRSRRLRMDAGADHPAPGDHHVAPRRGRAAEHERVERAPRRDAEQRVGVGSTTSTSARAPATSPQAGCPAARRRRRGCARRAARRSTAMPSSGAAATLRSALRQALAVFEPAQLLAPVARRRGCRSRSSAARRRRASRAGRRGRRRGWPRCSGRGRRRRRSPRPPRSPRGVACVAWTSCQRASSRPSRTQPLDRPRAGGGEAVVDLAASARRRGCGSARRNRRRASPASRSRRALAARSEWIGEAGVDAAARAGRARCARLRATRLRAPTAKAALVVAQRAAREAGALVQHRQQRQADAGVGGGVGERHRHRQRIVVRRCRRGRVRR